MTLIGGPPTLLKIVQLYSASRPGPSDYKSIWWDTRNIQPGSAGWHPTEKKVEMFAHPCWNKSIYRCDKLLNSNSNHLSKSVSGLAAELGSSNNLANYEYLTSQSGIQEEIINLGNVRKGIWFSLPVPEEENGSSAVILYRRASGWYAISVRCSVLFPACSAEWKRCNGRSLLQSTMSAWFPVTRPFLFLLSRLLWNQLIGCRFDCRPAPQKENEICDLKG